MHLRLPSSKTLWIDLGLAGFVLAIILVYTYVYFIKIPYIGLDIALDDQTVKWIYPNRYNLEVFRLEDKILLFGDIDLKQAYNQRTQPTYGNLKTGDVLDVFIRRGNEEKHVQWVIPGRTVVEFIQRLLSFWYLAFIFWAFGLATALLVRPRDDRWRLLVAFNYLMALWIMIGASSDSRIWYSAVFMRAISWLILVVSLALHWVFPRRITPPRAIIRNLFFLTGVALAIGEIFLLLPGNTYSFAILLCFLGSIGLLVYQWFSNPSIRTVLSLPLLVLGILIILAAESNFTHAFGGSSAPAEIILLFIPLLPMSYFYVIYGRQTGGMEIRLNRWIAMFVFFSIIILPIFPILAALNLWLSNSGLVEYMAVFYCVFTGILGIIYFPKFQRWFNYKFLGIPKVPDHLVSSIASHLSGSLEGKNLVHVLNSIVFPSFLIRQALLLRLLNLEPGLNRWEYRILSISGLPQPQYYSQEDIQFLIQKSDPAMIHQNSDYHVQSHHLDWVRLVLPLSLENRLVGLCLLGRRDPDDHYSPSELPLLQAVMDQVTLAQVHIEQTQHLRAFLQEDIQRQEAERLRLAHRLHDEVLGQLAVLGQNFGDSKAGTRFQENYEATVRQVREVIAGLRPAALNYGLEPAMNDLVDRISEINRTSSILEFNLQVDQPESPRYPPEVELQVYRIVQQACQNALQHASAAHIWVNGVLNPGALDMTVIDDGKGFDTSPVIDFEELLKRKHYGLVGMAERAALIHASLVIITAPAAGTEVRLHWQASPMV